tara:strand:- start:412 stop:777 length:366 start_codon:yes stop_codon:yes gene_type:complete
MRGALIIFMALSMLAACVDQQIDQQQGYQKVIAYDADANLTLRRYGRLWTVPVGIAVAFQACQDIKPNKNFNKMKLKKNCFRDLALSYDAGAFQACQDIKPNKNLYKMFLKKNCFRDLVLL